MLILAEWPAAIQTGVDREGVGAVIEKSGQPHSPQLSGFAGPVLMC
jgi:hypothetical protein